jgi:hypothetical protein
VFLRRHIFLAPEEFWALIRSKRLGEGREEGRREGETREIPFFIK